LHVRENTLQYQGAVHSYVFIPHPLIIESNRPIEIEY